MAIDYTIAYDAHTVLYAGEVYNMKAGKFYINNPTKTYYICFDPTRTAGDEYFRYDGSEQSLQSEYPYAHIMFYINRSENNGNPQYYGDESAGLNWKTLSVDFTDIQNIELMFEFPYGLYGSPVGKSISTASCALFAQYRSRSTSSDEWGSWSNFDFNTIEKLLKTETYDDNVQAGIIQRNNRNPFNISLSAVVGDNTLDSTIQYQIRTAVSSSLLVTLVNVAGIVYGEKNENGDRAGHSYPGEPLIGIKALASGQISGDLDVQVDVERSKVWVYDGTNNYPDHPGWGKLDANKHAWAVYDILANGHPDHPAYPTLGNGDADSVYGCNISAAQIDYELFKTWADYITSLGYELNIVFDTFTTAWDAVLKICMEGRGMIYPQGSKIYAYVDKPTNTSQLFTVGNIHLDTFVQSYADEQQKANMIEITYMDKERHYERTQIALRTSDWDSGTDPNNPTNLTLYGTTDYDQAVSTAQYMLLCNELLFNSLAFSVDVDALASEAGDVIEVQHDVLGSYGGRIRVFVENLLDNSGFEEGTYTSDWAPWRVGGLPDVDTISTGVKRSGSYASHIRSVVNNCGRSQTVACTPSTEYTFSAYVYLEDLNYNDAVSGRFRIMSYDGTDYYQDYVTTTTRGSWQRVSFTMTTGASQTSMYVWIGGKGAGYWDNIQVETGDTAHAYIGKTGVQLDKTVTLTSVAYTLKIMDSNGAIDAHVTNIGAGSNTWLTFGDSIEWTNSPAKYDVYAFGLTANFVRKYRITDIGRSTELRRTIMAIQYDENTHEGYAPSDEEPTGENVWAAKTVAPSPTTIQTIANALNRASNVQLRETLSTNRVTGEIQSSVVVAWDPEQGHVRGGWEVWYRDVDESDVDWEGTYREGGIYTFGAKVEHEGVTYISLEDYNTSIPISR